MVLWANSFTLSTTKMKVLQPIRSTNYGNHQGKNRHSLKKVFQGCITDQCTGLYVPFLSRSMMYSSCWAAFMLTVFLLSLGSLSPSCHAISEMAALSDNWVEPSRRMTWKDLGLSRRSSLKAYSSERVLPHPLGPMTKKLPEERPVLRGCSNASLICSTFFSKPVEC